MIDFSNTQLDKLIVHRVGNQLRDEKYFVSEHLIDVDEALNDLLIKYFCKSFIAYTETFHFVHNLELAYNEINGIVKNIFDSPEIFYKNSVSILKHLYEQSNHPHIKSGDLFVCVFKNIIFNNEEVSAIAIFKSENTNQIIINKETGISIKKIDKGCLILNTEPKDGYRILSIDNNSYDAEYWKKNFLSIDFIKDDNFETKNYINLCKSFAKEIIAKEVGKKEQIDFLSQSVNYFENNEHADTDDFNQTIFGDDETINKFNTYKAKYEEENDLQIAEDFEISKSVLKKQKRTIKNFIKLDTNIQIKLDFKDPDASNKFVEKGFDKKKNMYFYKVFFNNEIN